jgi:HPt (histidine-containing phosphotransfer) domain-containing protein
LKGASGNIGAVALASLCAHLEQLAVEGRSEAVPQALDRVRIELREVRDEVVAVHHIH